ncbi:MAG TPA: hypothetical protein VMV46_21490, partial [Thermoanaerobaculia bacterium]|nr:hypothetical protein [Thermoanaerobaculia bacterium]
MIRLSFEPRQSCSPHRLVLSDDRGAGLLADPSLGHGFWGTTPDLKVPDLWDAMLEGVTRRRFEFPIFGLEGTAEGQLELDFVRAEGQDEL